MSKKYEFVNVSFDSAWKEWGNGTTEGNLGGFRLSWICKGVSPLPEGIGWGQLTFYMDNEGTMKCDNEGMSQAFVEAALLEFAKTLVRTGK